MEHNTRYLIVEILEKLKMPSIAIDARTQPNGNILHEYVKIIEKKAKELNDACTLERLYFAGLIY